MKSVRPVPSSRAGLTARPTTAVITHARLTQPGPPGKTSVTCTRCFTISLPNVTGLRWSWTYDSDDLKKSSSFAALWVAVLRRGTDRGVRPPGRPQRGWRNLVIAVCVEHENRGRGDACQQGERAVRGDGDRTRERRHRDWDRPPLPSQPREQNHNSRITSTSNVYDFTRPEYTMAVSHTVSAAPSRNEIETAYQPRQQGGDTGPADRGIRQSPWVRSSWTCCCRRRGSTPSARAPGRAVSAPDR